MTSFLSVSEQVTDYETFNDQLDKFRENNKYKIPLIIERREKNNATQNIIVLVDIEL